MEVVTFIKGRQIGWAEGTANPPQQPLRMLVLQVSRRPAEQVQFYLEFSDNHVEAR